MKKKDNITTYRGLAEYIKRNKSKIEVNHMSIQETCKNYTLEEIRAYYLQRKQEEAAAAGKVQIDWTSDYTKITKEGEKEIKPYFAIATLDSENKQALQFLKKADGLTEEKGKDTICLTFSGHLPLGAVVRTRQARKDNAKPESKYFIVEEAGLKELTEEQGKAAIGQL